MVQLKTEALFDLIKKKGIQAEMQKETGQIFFGFKALDQNFAIFMRVYEQSQLLQMIVFLPIQYDDKNIGEVARLLHWINQAIDLPGFGMEEGGKTIFYRLMLPAIGMQFDEKLLEPFLGAMRNVCETFYPSIVKVATEGVTFDEMKSSFGGGAKT
jgi:hypothetical protein